MTLRGTDPESYITEYTLVYEDKIGSCVVVQETLGDTWDEKAEQAWKEVLPPFPGRRCYPSCLKGGA